MATKFGKKFCEIEENSLYGFEHGGLVIVRRDCEKAKDQTYVEFARTKEQLFDRWCSSEKICQDHAKLRQLILIEEFKSCIRSNIKTFINEGIICKINILIGFI